MTIERNSAVDTLAERLEALAEWNDSTPPSHTTTVAEMFDRLVGRGLNAEQVVAVHLPRSAEMVVSVLAIMVAGGAFLPVDPEWPEQRRRQVLDDAGAVLMATPTVSALARRSSSSRPPSPSRVSPARRRSSGARTSRARSRSCGSTARIRSSSTPR